MKISINKNNITFKIDTSFKNKSLEEFLDSYKQGKKNKYLLFQNKRISVNNKEVTSSYILQENDLVQIRQEKESIDFKPYEKDLDVVYEDDLVLIVYKPKNMLIHDDKSNKALANLVANYYKNQNIDIYVRYIHRLDYETQGLVMFVKNSFFLPLFDYNLANKNIQRFYKALVFKRDIKSKHFIINKKIGRDRHISNRYRISKTGKEATTIVKIEKDLGKYLLLDLKLLSGRTHQIRVHLSSENYYIINDSIYGKKSDDLDHMGLYAYKLEWIDPLTNKKRQASKLACPLLK